MKITRADRVIDLDKFDSVRCRESLFGPDSGYPVEAARSEASFWGTVEVTEEIARPIDKLCAKMLVADISTAWTEGKAVFDVDAWFAAKKEES